MTKVKFSKPINRLSWRAGLRGLTSAEAVFQAEKNIQSVRPVIIDDIDANLKRLSAICLIMDENNDSLIAEIYRNSDSIAAIAGTFELEALGKIAFCLCEMLSIFEENDLWYSKPIKIYIDAMHIMRHSVSLEKKEIQEIIDNTFILLQYFKEKVNDK